MKLLFYLMILTGMLALSACSIPYQTSSARAAYGNAVPDFKANKKQNQKKKKRAHKAAKRKNVRENKSYFYRRPY